MADIKNPLLMAATKWDYERWDLAPFPRGITWSDQDAHVEIDGNFMLLEHKQADYLYDPYQKPPELPFGQRRALQTHADQGAYVLVIHGDREHADPRYIVRLSNAAFGSGFEINLMGLASTLVDRQQFLRELMRSWSKWATTPANRRPLSPESFVPRRMLDPPFVGLKDQLGLPI